SMTHSTPEDLFLAYRSDRPSPSFFETNITRVMNYLQNEKAFKLSEQDKAGIRHVAEAFFKSGPDLTYTFIGGYGDFKRQPTYSGLMSEGDGAPRHWKFLGTDDQLRAIQDMQQRNLIGPHVRDVA